MDERRNDFRRRANDRFLSQRRTAETDAYTQSFEQALGLMEKRDAFDVSQGNLKKTTSAMGDTTLDSTA